MLGACVGASHGCADSDSDAAGAHESGGDGDDARDAGASGASKEADAGANGGALPPENEVTLSFEVPQAGMSAVYVPNPTTNRVAVVDASNYAIESLTVGSRPAYAATVPGKDIALVINAGSRDAALLRTEGGVTKVQRLEVGHDANAIAISPDGLHAVLYLNASASGGSAQSFQDLTVVDLTPSAERARRVSVGFRPRGVQFSSDGKQAFVITEDGISVLDFAALSAGPTIARLVRLGDALGDPQSIDVQVTPSGAFALARREGDSTLRLVSLVDGRIETLALASLTLPPPLAGGGTSLDAGTPASGPDLTDLDIVADGSFAVAVLRDRGALVRIPLPGGFRDPSTVRVRSVSDQLIGSISIARTGHRAIAYTTALPVEGVVLIDDIQSDSAPRSVILRKAVKAVALSDDGTRALVLHTPVTGGASSQAEDARIDASEGYTVVDMVSGFAKLQLTSAALRERDLLITPDGSRLFALLRDDVRGVRAVDMIDLSSFQVSSLALGKPPTSIGFLPGLSRVFVGQAGEGGLITFLDAQAGTRLRDVSGFEIASRIRQ